jgi:hypothetical protein
MESCKLFMARGQLVMAITELVMHWRECVECGKLFMACGQLVMNIWIINSNLYYRKHDKKRIGGGLLPYQLVFCMIK